MGHLDMVGNPIRRGDTVLSWDWGLAPATVTWMTTDQGQDLPSRVTIKACTGEGSRDGISADTLLVLPRHGRSLVKFGMLQNVFSEQGVPAALMLGYERGVASRKYPGDFTGYSPDYQTGYQRGFVVRDWPSGKPGEELGVVDCVGVPIRAQSIIAMADPFDGQLLVNVAERIINGIIHCAFAAEIRAPSECRVIASRLDELDGVREF